MAMNYRSVLGYGIIVSWEAMKASEVRPSPFIFMPNGCPSCEDCPGIKMAPKIFKAKRLRLLEDRYEIAIYHDEQFFITTQHAIKSEPSDYTVVDLEDLQADPDYAALQDFVREFFSSYKIDLILFSYRI